MINSFSGEYKFLSNFYLCEVYLDGVPYKSVEHAYQAAKFEHLHEREKVRNCATPGYAKRLGKSAILSDDWNTRKLLVMRDLLEQKFRVDSDLCEMLKSTYPKEIVEGNNWGDTFWGVCNNKGLNHLGRMLVDIRFNRIFQE